MISKPKQWIEERHTFWWDFLCHSMPLPKSFDISLPSIECTGKISKRIAGSADIKGCTYVLAYMLQEQEGYDITIAHEICHVFADRISIHNRGHGPFWKFLFNDVCNLKREKYHTYTKPTAKSLIMRFSKGV